MIFIPSTCSRITSRITSRVSSRIWHGAIWHVRHLRADSEVWLSHTSSVWPWSGAPKVFLYDTFLGGLHQLCCVVLCCVVLLCPVVLCVVTWAGLATILVVKWYWPSQNDQLLHAYITKLGTKYPKYKRMSKLIIIQRCCICFDLLVQSSVGRALSMQKVCQHLAR